MLIKKTACNEIKLIISLLIKASDDLTSAKVFDQNTIHIWNTIYVHSSHYHFSIFWMRIFNQLQKF